MKRILWILLFGFFACSENSDDQPDNLLLLSDREVVCEGQMATLRLYSTLQKTEVSLADFVFDPVPATIGSITSEGILTLGNIASVAELSITGTYQRTTKISTKIQVKPSSGSSEPSLVSAPGDFFKYGEGASYYFWPDGSVVLETATTTSEASKTFELTKYSGQGDLQWKKDLGPGEVKFIQVQQEKIFAAGQLKEIGGAEFMVVLVFDLEGNLIFEKKEQVINQKGMVGFVSNAQGDFYLSYFSSGETNEPNLSKFNAQGEKEWDIHPEETYTEMFIFPDGNLAAKSYEGIGAELYFDFFNANGVRGKRVKAGGDRTIFTGPEGMLASADLLQSESSGPFDFVFNAYYDLFSSTGEKVMDKKLLYGFDPAYESAEYPTQKKNTPGGYYHYLTTTNGEIHLLHSSTWGDYSFFKLNSNAGQKWNWWKENKAGIPEKEIKPLQIIEHQNFLILIGYSDRQLYRFRLGLDYTFDDCLKTAYWNTFERF